MSEKKRRDIKLGEMQDQCLKMNGHCERFENKPECPFKEVCEGMSGKEYAKTPLAWNLTDPPRFNEAQMALLRAFSKMGATIVQQSEDAVRFYTNTPLTEIAVVFTKLIDNDHMLDLAELLGKDGAEC